MKIGATGGLDRVDRLEELGFDLIEFSVGGISALSPEGRAKISGVLAGKNIAWHSCNGLFPGNITPLCRDEGMQESRAYLERMLPILAEFGVKTVVFGSGSFRRMPEEIPQERRRQLIREFLVLLEGIARENGIIVAVEPLNKLETNMLNTTAEAMEYIRELDLPNLKLLVDLYHFWREGEPMERIYEYGPYIRHVHIAEPTNRDFLRGSDEYDYTPFFEALRSIGYDGAVVFEGGKGDFDSGIGETYPILRRFCE